MSEAVALAAPARRATPRMRVRKASKPLLARRFLPLACALVALVAGWQRRWTSDDGFITLRVAEQIATGHGPVYNRGERVEASTSVLWTWLLGIVRFVTHLSLPWTAIALGLTFSALGIAFAVRGSVRAWEELAPGTVLVPFGIVIPLCISAFWDYETAGLEGGMVTLWLGGSWLLLVGSWSRARSVRGSSWYSFVAAFVIGLGWLVRPDLVTASLALLVGLVLVDREGWRRRAALAGSAVALPVLYQLFRMGYYAVLVPNTAIAKEAGKSRWGQGFLYLWDTLGTYWLLVPLVLLVVGYVLQRPGREGRVLLGAPVVGGLLEAGYVTRVGGDFMHARMLLPAIFLMMLPVAVIPLRGGPVRALVPPVLVAVWGLLAMVAFRSGYTSDATIWHGIADERAFYVGATQDGHPVTPYDWRKSPFAFVAWVFASHAQASKTPIFWHAIGDPGPAPYPIDPVMAKHGLGDVFAYANIGLVGYVVGPQAHILDPHGLPDPVAARTVLAQRGRPGHEKDLPLAWDFAQVVDPAAQLPASITLTDVVAARQAVNCGTLGRVRRDISGPIDFWRNVKDSFGNTTLRFSPNPETARDELCS